MEMGIKMKTNKELKKRIVQLQVQIERKNIEIEKLKKAGTK